MYNFRSPHATNAAWPQSLPSTRDLDNEAREWRAYAHNVAATYDARLVNRRDVWGAYLSVERRTHNRSTYTAPGKSWRGSWQLNATRLRRHVLAESVGHVVGLHSTSAEDTSRWGAFDLDAHGPQSEGDASALTLAAAALAAQLDAAGAVPIIEDSNGAGGYHVWCYFDAPVPTASAYAWLDALAERVRIDFGVAVETFPKQASARGAFGNWLRLPGRHHTRAHWSRFARYGDTWRTGADAVRTLLEWPATPATVVPPRVAPRSAALVRAFGNVQPPSNRAPVIVAYVNKLVHGAAGTGRSNRLFSLARFLRCGMCCTDEEALGVMRAWNAGNAPPLPDEKVVATWSNSQRYSARPFTLRTGARYAI